MDKLEYRSVIKYLRLKGMTPAEIHEMGMMDTLGEHAPSYATVKRWVNEFKRGRNNVEDEPRSGRPLTATTPDNIDLVLEIVMEDRRTSTYHIAKRLRTSQERADHIVKDELGMSTVSAR